MHSMIAIQTAAHTWGVGLPKRWAFACSGDRLDELASLCRHTQGQHQDIWGKGDKYGMFISRHTAEYPVEVCDAYAIAIQYILSPCELSSPIPFANTTPNVMPPELETPTRGPPTQTEPIILRDQHIGRKAGVQG